MKKIYQSNKFKKYNKRPIKSRKHKNFSERNFSIPKSEKPKSYGSDSIKIPLEIKCNESLCLLSQTKDSIQFISRIYDSRNYGYINNNRIIDLNFENLLNIDYCMISVLITLIDDFNGKGIFFRMKLPNNKFISDYLKDSGLLNKMKDNSGKPFRVSKVSDSIFFEKGSGKLERKENIRISKAVQSIVEHLTGQKGNFAVLKTIFLEICGNSIEWSGPKQQWLLGVKYEKDKVIITVVDLGLGMLKTINKKFKHIIKDLNKDEHEVLDGAFDKKYGSKSQEKNRNKGLPFVKAKFLENKISKLRVVTNNVILNFDDTRSSETLKDYLNFSGTVYRWEMTKSNLI